MLYALAVAIAFPLDSKGRVDNWLWQHMALTWLIFAVAMRITGSFGWSCLLAAAFFPLRALLWKAPWAPGHDVNDPFTDYGWGALAPVISVLVVYISFK
jgi:hypothetical protein